MASWEDYTGRRLFETEKSLKVQGFVTALRITSVIYDISTIIFYSIFQRPWLEWRRRRLMQSVPIQSDAPLSTGMAPKLMCLDDTLLNISTIDELVNKIIEKYNERRCFGSREIFSETEEVQPDGKVFKKYTMGDYNWLSFNEVDTRINEIATGLYHSGIRSRQNVAIFAETRMEWMLTAMAMLRHNIPIVTIYATLGDEGIVHGLRETEVTHLVTSQELLPKIIKLLPKLSSVTHIIYFENATGTKQIPPQVPSQVHLIPFSKILDLGKTQAKVVCDDIPEGNDTALIMYTSGSTGVPKAAMITHINLMATVKTYHVYMPPVTVRDAYISYLPLAHIAEFATQFVMLYCGMKVGFSSPITLTDKSTGVLAGQKGDVSILRPTFLVAVPLVMDRVRKGITEGAREKGTLSNVLLRYAIPYKVFWQKLGFSTPLLNRVLFKKLKAILGGRLRVLISGSAPLCSETYEFMQACFDPEIFMVAYGLTEVTGAPSVGIYPGNSVAPVGGGGFTKLIDWEEGGYTCQDQPHPRGEIVLGGEHVCKGYYKNEAESTKTFYTENGVRWCYTGDIGELLPNGTFRIIDRKKDIVKLQYGEYVAIGKVERELKTCPLVDNICLYGNSLATHLVALISPNAKALEDLARSLNITVTASDEDDRSVMAQLCQMPEINKAATQQILQYAKQHCSLNKMEIPASLKLCPEEWLPNSGLVTATLKIRRPQVYAFYKNEIEKLYANLSRQI